MTGDGGLGRYRPLALLTRQLVQLLCPRRCPFCGRVLGLVPRCQDCEPELQRLVRKDHSPSFRPSDGMAYAPPVWAAAPFWYEGILRQAVIQAKYEDKPWIAVQLGCLMARFLFQVPIDCKGGVEVPRPPAHPLIDCDLVVPVAPSGRGRTYNVPELMARPLARGLGIPLEPDALFRRNPGRPQASMTRQERLVAVMGQFSADADHVSGRRILLIDDVVTTGSTAAACIQALQAAGAVSVAFAALATPRGHNALPAAPGIPFDDPLQDRPPEDEEEPVLEF